MLRQSGQYLGFCKRLFWGLGSQYNRVSHNHDTVQGRHVGITSLRNSIVFAIHPVLLREVQDELAKTVSGTDSQHDLNSVVVPD